MQIIQAASAHLNDILTLNKQFHLEIPDFFWDTTKWIDTQIKNGTYWVLTDGDSVCGAICLTKTGEELQINAIAVKENMHHKGFGKMLVDFAKNTAKKSGKKSLTVGSFCDYNLEGFYKKCGFIKTEKLGCYNGYPFFQFTMKI